jgi:L-threonylcarbamoyladenylate synthase
MPADPTTYAQQLYGTLRSTDEYDLSAILCEQVPSESAWDAVRDRITRAAAAFTSLNR